MMDLLQGWAAVTAVLFTAGHFIDEWMDDAQKLRFSERVFPHIDPSRSLRWIQQVNMAYLQLFDRIYGWRSSKLNRNLWLAIIFSYVLFAEARLTVYIFSLQPPDLPITLFIAIGCAVGTVMLLHGFFESGELLRLFKQSELERSFNLLTQPGLLLALASGMVGICIIVTLTAITVNAMEFNNLLLIGLGGGSLLILPTMAIVSLIPESWHPVNPSRALVSSLLFVVVLGLIFKDARNDFFDALLLKGPVLLSFVAFNMFADTVSLVETRWILLKSQSSAFFTIFLLMVSDVVLSGLIYLLFPLIIAKDFNIFLKGIVFDGPSPWIGLYFWTTFSTSLLFYLFFLSAFFLKIFSPFSGFLHTFLKIFRFELHPIRCIFFIMVVLETIIFIICLIYRLGS